MDFSNAPACIVCLLSSACTPEDIAISYSLVAKASAASAEETSFWSPFLALSNTVRALTTSLYFSCPAIAIDNDCISLLNCSSFSSFSLADSSKYSFVPLILFWSSSIRDFCCDNCLEIVSAPNPDISVFAVTCAVLPCKSKAFSCASSPARCLRRSATAGVISSSSAFDLVALGLSSSWNSCPIERSPESIFCISSSAASKDLPFRFSETTFFSKDSFLACRVSLSTVKLLRAIVSINTLVCNNSAFLSSIASKSRESCALILSSVFGNNPIILLLEAILACCTTFWASLCSNLNPVTTLSFNAFSTLSLTALICLRISPSRTLLPADIASSSSIRNCPACFDAANSDC